VQTTHSGLIPDIRRKCDRVDDAVRGTGILHLSECLNYPTSLAHNQKEALYIKTFAVGRE
jgi:hypothetical protein